MAGTSKPLGLQIASTYQAPARKSTNYFKNKTDISILRCAGPAERRHWELFYHLAGRETDAEALGTRFQSWLEFEAHLARGLGVSPAVHG